MKVSYNNLVLTATITASTEDASYPFQDALMDLRLSRIGRTTAITSQYVDIELLTAVEVESCIILGHNISESATISIQASHFSDFNELEVDEVATWSEEAIYCLLTPITTTFSGNITYSSSNITYGGQPITIDTEHSEELKYWRIDIDEIVNPDGYIEIAFVHLGSLLTMPGFDRVHTFANNTNSVATKSPSRQLYGDKRITYRSASFDFKDVSEADRLLIDAFFEDVQNIKPYVMLVWENDLDIQPPIYVANTTQQLNWKRSDVEGLYWNFSLPCEECF